MTTSLQTAVRAIVVDVTKHVFLPKKTKWQAAFRSSNRLSTGRPACPCQVFVAFYPLSQMPASEIIKHIFYSFLPRDAL